MVHTANDIRVGLVLGGNGTWLAEPRRGAAAYFKTRDMAARWCLLEGLNHSTKNSADRLISVAFLYKSTSGEIECCDWYTGDTLSGDWQGYAKSDSCWMHIANRDGERAWTAIMQNELPLGLENVVGVFLADDSNFDLRTTVVEMPDLPRTKSGNVFDAVLRGGWAGDVFHGYAYGSDARPDGAAIRTSAIVDIGFLPPFGYYIETKGRSRYLLAMNLADSSWRQWLDHKKKHIAQNADYFRQYQWSKSSAAIVERII